MIIDSEALFAAFWLWLILVSLVVGFAIQIAAMLYQPGARGAALRAAPPYRTTRVAAPRSSHCTRSL
jgi:hypothetical protein